MDGKRLLHSLTLEDFLSFGSQPVNLALEPLNILIGPNASGKSNFIQALELLRSAPANLAAPIYQAGGIEEWLYKGDGANPIAKIAAAVENPLANGLLYHSFSFTATANGQLFTLITESIKNPETMPYYSYENGASSIRFEATPPEEKLLQGIKRDLSILSQRTDPDSYPALAYLAEQYRAIKIYRDFNLEGPNSPRRAQQPDLPTDFLEENRRNLSLILSDLQFRDVMPKIVEKLQAVYEDVEDVIVRVGGGTMQTFIRERGMSSPIPAARLSDGTLRYLCLLAILYHPTPPPLICLEEPEVGLHPDLISGLAEMLKEASQRTQLIVTTHSDLLVSKFSDQPEAVVVCERTPSGTTLERLDARKLESWLEEYSLGEVWLRGGIGGTRW